MTVTDFVQCPDCKDRGGGWEWRYALTPMHRDAAVRDGWTYEGGVWLEDGLAWTLCRSCVSCTHVHETIEWRDPFTLREWTAEQKALGRRVVLDVDWARSLLGGRASALSEPSGRVVFSIGTSQAREERER